MAGAKQPIELVVAKGKKHLTKAEIASRTAQAVKSPKPRRVASPPYLPTALKAKFTKLAKKLVALNILTEIDADALARYLISESIYLKFTQMLIKTLAAEDITDAEMLKRATELTAEQDRYSKQCRSAAADLGLTVSSRCRLVVPALDKPDVPREEEELFG